MSRYHIDTDITEADDFVWGFTGIYWDPWADEKENTWRLLRNLKHHNSKPWLCMGDFNEILYGWEKEGGVPRTQRCMDRFRLTLKLIKGCLVLILRKHTFVCPEYYLRSPALTCTGHRLTTAMCNFLQKPNERSSLLILLILVFACIAE